MNGPQSLGGSPVHVFLYVEDADALFEGRSRQGRQS